MLSGAKLKLVQSLKLKKFRQKYNLFVAEGDKLIESLITQDRYGIEEIFASPDWIDENQDLKLVNKLNIVDTKDLKKLSGLQLPPSVLCTVRIPNHSIPWPTFEKIILLDEVQDPGNVGSIIRTADWFGFDAVVRSSGTADFYNPKVVQGSMGSFANVWLISGDIKLLKIQRPGLAYLATAMNGEDLRTISQPDAFCLIIGNEGRGIRKEIIGASDQLVSIRGASKRLAESLNAAVATAIFCHELTRD